MNSKTRLDDFKNKLSKAAHELAEESIPPDEKALHEFVKLLVKEELSMRSPGSPFSRERRIERILKLVADEMP